MATDKLIVMKLTAAVEKKNWNPDQYLKLQGHYILVAFRYSA